MSNENFNEVVELILKGIEKIPNPLRDRLEKELIKIKEMIMDSRPPRILILGRRGAGKSSLINAIFKEKVAKVGSVIAEQGKAIWHPFENAKGSINILDTRGLGDLTKPESAEFEEAIDEIKNAIKSICPDTILFLCKARDVDSHITHDIEKVQEISKYISTSHKFDIPVIALVTQVDELDPIRIEPPYENETKQENIDKAVNTLNDAFKNSKNGLLKIIPVSAYAEYDNNVISYNRYWNIDLVIEYLMEVLPNSAQLQMARLSSLRKIQCKFARVLIGSTASICAGIAATPIPIVDIIPITSAQIGMITGIAYISGRKLSKKSAMEYLTALGINTGTAVVLREGVRGLLKLVPGAGNAASAAVAFAGTWGIGEAAIAYFIDKKSIEETKRRFEKTKREHKIEEIDK